MSRAIVIFLAVAAMGAGAAGCEIGNINGGGDCNNGSPLLGEGGAGGGAATTTTGTGGEGGSGGAWHPFKIACDPSDSLATETVNCATSLSTWPPPPAAPLGVRIEIKLPVASCIREVRAFLVPATGHVTLPAMLPGFELVASPTGDPSDLYTIGTTQDKSATVESYESPHPLSFFPIDPGVYVEADSDYAIIYLPESGAGAVGGSVASDWKCIVRK